MKHESNNARYEKEIIAKLQQIPENELTKNIIIPLLETLGFQKVEFFGGPDEKGKDIVCWEVDKTGDIKLIVAQVKHFKFTNKSSNPQSLQTIINQLTNCFKNSLLYTNKTRHLPSEAYVITTFPVDTKSLHTRFGDHPDLKDAKIKIIDGTKLATLLLAHNPEIVSALLGLGVEVNSALKDSLNNEILLKALGYQKKKDIKNIYIDIDFSIGKRTTQLFFNASFKPRTRLLSLNLQGWLALKMHCAEIEHEFSLNFLNKGIDEIDTSLKDRVGKHQTQKRFLLTRLDKLTKELAETLDADLIKVRKLVVTELNKEIKDIEDNEPKVEILLNGHILAEEIQTKRKWIESKVEEFNLATPEQSKLEYFIKKCKSIIDAAAVFFTNFEFDCIGYNEKKVVRNNFESTRFKLPIQHVFDTGANIAVLGEAGAGKTTSLQMYALSSEGNSNKLVICVPLANVTQHWSKADPNLRTDEKRSALDEAIAKYLTQRGIKISPSEFCRQLTTKRTVLLLDGIDEAIKLNPWLPEGIEKLADKYKTTVQVIVTSRMSGAYLDQIPFFAITLLPFTNDQRNLFVEKWFDPEDKEIVNKIKNHLKKNKPISEIIKTPLLTTTLCVLAKNDIDLPNTEIKLYNDRLRLLTGYYDRAKNIDVRMSSTPQTLELISQKLAFYLHSIGEREKDRDFLQAQAVRESLNILSKKEAETALDELIDPCNILVPMTEDGKFGFGHLSFQEHLAAKEIISNRNINILPLLKQSWWRGALVLFAQMNTHLQWLVRDIGDRGGITAVKEVLTAMVHTRPKTEQDLLKSLIQSYSRLEKGTHVVDEESEDII